MVYDHDGREEFCVRHTDREKKSEEEKRSKKTKRKMK